MRGAAYMVPETWCDIRCQAQRKYDCVMRHTTSVKRVARSDDAARVKMALRRPVKAAGDFWPSPLRRGLDWPADGALRAPEAVSRGRHSLEGKANGPYVPHRATAAIAAIGAAWGRDFQLFGGRSWVTLAHMGKWQEMRNVYKTSRGHRQENVDGA